MSSTTNGGARLNVQRQVNYWRRNLKTFLSHHYTSNDSNRMTLAFFIVSALDLLGDLDKALSPEERQGHIEWIYHCQLPEGGFRAFPGADFGSLRNKGNRQWDPACVPATFFALLLLALLKDDLQRVKRREILEWLRTMQRPDGSFGEFLGEGDRIEGGSDTRFGYMATATRWILRGNVEGEVDGVPDINVDKFVEYVRKCETYDGAISDGMFHEAHAGFTCCAISALHFVDRLPPRGRSPQDPDSRIRGISNLPLTLHWLTSRQTLNFDEDEVEDTLADGTDPPETCHDVHAFVKLGSHPSSKIAQASLAKLPLSEDALEFVGFNGRCNKVGDTCYAYWVCAPLLLLGHLDLVDPRPVRRWLLEKTQHMVGGFGKFPGDLPDILHSFLGLCALAMFKEQNLKDFDAALCMSVDAKQHLESLGWRRAIVGDGGTGHEGEYFSYMAMSGG